MNSPQMRLVVRAILAGVAVLVTKLVAADGEVTMSLVVGAATAGGWAALEYITPLNALVGLFRNPPDA